MKRRSFLRNGLLVVFALVMVASMPLAVSADQVDDRDQDELEDDSDECVEYPGSLHDCIDVDELEDELAEPSETTGYTEPVDRVEYECACFSPNKAAAKELADVGAYEAIEELMFVDAAEFLEDYEGVDPSEVLDDQDDSDEREIDLDAVDLDKVDYIQLDQDDSDEEVIEATILPIWDLPSIDQDDISVCTPSGECFGQDESSSGLQPAPFCSPDGDCVNIPEDAGQDDRDEDVIHGQAGQLPDIQLDQDESEGIDEDTICHNTVYLDEDGGLDSDYDDGWAC